MNVTVELTGNPIFPWQVSSLCRTLAEATAKATRIEAVDPLAFLPTYGAGIAIADGYPATGGGLATHYTEPAHEPSPAVAALIAEVESRDTAVDALKAGEAYMPEGAA